jgi:hypothetical protein
LSSTDLGPIAITDMGGARPPIWTFGAVGTAHILVSALILSHTSPIILPDFLENVEIVTLKEAPAPSPLANPEVRPNVLEDATPALPELDTLVPSETAPPEAEAVSPTPPAVAEQAPLAAPTQSNVVRAQGVELAQEPVPIPKAVAPLKNQVPEVAPSLPSLGPPLPALRPMPPASPLLRQPAPAPLQLQGKALKANTSPALPKAAEIKIPDASVADVPAPTPPAPLVVPKPQLALPKVQVPRIPKLEVRQPEPAVAAPSSAAETIASAGARAAANSPAASGASGTLPRANTAAGAPITTGVPSQGVAAASTGAGGGALPRRPGGAGVTGVFPSGQGGGLLGRMAQTSDCARINRERDGKCPDWDPLEGGSPRTAKSFTIAVPKDAAPGRYAIGTNPLPLCPRGTPQAQFGLSCLPSNEGPGIPRP